MDLRDWRWVAGLICPLSIEMEMNWCKPIKGQRFSLKSRIAARLQWPPRLLSPIKTCVEDISRWQRRGSQPPINIPNHALTPLFCANAWNNASPYSCYSRKFTSMTCLLGMNSSTQTQWRKELYHFRSFIIGWKKSCGLTRIRLSNWSRPAPEWTIPNYMLIWAGPCTIDPNFPLTLWFRTRMIRSATYSRVKFFMTTWVMRWKSSKIWISHCTCFTNGIQRNQNSMSRKLYWKEKRPTKQRRSHIRTRDYNI